MPRTVQLEEPPWDNEGVYCAFVDPGCGVACTTYQQT